MSAGATADAVIWGTQLLAVAASLRARGLTALMRAEVALTAVTGLVLSLRHGYWAGAGFCAVTLALLLGDWWKRRGRKVAKALGLKSRAVIAGLVERAREAGPAPVPQGVRA